MFPLEPETDAQPIKVPFDRAFYWWQSGWLYFRDAPARWLLVALAQIVLAVLGACLSPPCLVPFEWAVIWGGSTLLVTNVCVDPQPLPSILKKVVNDVKAILTPWILLLLLLGGVWCFLLWSGGTIDFHENLPSQSPFDLRWVVFRSWLMQVVFKLGVLPLLFVIAFSLLIFVPNILLSGQRSFAVAVQRSVRSVLRNAGPWVSFYLLGMGLFVVALLSGFGLLILLPVFQIALYVAYRDIFVAQ